MVRILLIYYAIQFAYKQKQRCFQHAISLHTPQYYLTARSIVILMKLNSRLSEKTLNVLLIRLFVAV